MFYDNNNQHACNISIASTHQLNESETTGRKIPNRKNLEWNVGYRKWV